MTEEQQEIIRGQIAAKLTDAGIDDYEVTDIDDGKTPEMTRLLLNVFTDGKSYPGSICGHANALASQVIALLSLVNVEMHPLEELAEGKWHLPFEAEYRIAVPI